MLADQSVSALLATDRMNLYIDILITGIRKSGYPPIGPFLKFQLGIDQYAVI